MYLVQILTSFMINEKQQPLFNNDPYHEVRQVQKLSQAATNKSLKVSPYCVNITWKWCNTGRMDVPAPACCLVLSWLSLRKEKAPRIVVCSLNTWLALPSVYSAQPTISGEVKPTLF